jgi:hypothetical protein
MTRHLFDVPVLQFFRLHLLLLDRVLWEKSQWVESKVTWFTIKFVHVGIGRDGDSLQEGDPSKDLDHGVRKSIMGINDPGDGLERELFAWDANEFRNDHACASQHGSTTILQFRLAEPWKPLGSALDTIKVGGMCGKCVCVLVMIVVCVHMCVLFCVEEGSV